MKTGELFDTYGHVLEDEHDALEMQQLAASIAQSVDSRYGSEIDEQRGGGRFLKKKSRNVKSGREGKEIFTFYANYGNNTRAHPQPRGRGDRDEDNAVAPVTPHWSASTATALKPKKAQGNGKGRGDGKNKSPGKGRGKGPRSKSPGKGRGKSPGKGRGGKGRGRKSPASSSGSTGEFTGGSGSSCSMCTGGGSSSSIRPLSPHANPGVESQHYIRVQNTHGKSSFLIPMNDAMTLDKLMMRMLYTLKSPSSSTPSHSRRSSTRRSSKSYKRNEQSGGSCTSCGLPI
jgi:hypothetical protein